MHATSAIDIEVLFIYIDRKERARTAGRVEMGNVVARTKLAARCRSDDTCKNTVLVRLEERVLSVVMSPIAILTNTAGQTFVRFDEHTTTYYTFAGGTTKGCENRSLIFVEF